jgi:hypothetical protein
LRHSRYTNDTPLPFDLPSVRRKKLTVDFAGVNQSSNGGLLLPRQAERKHGVCLRASDAIDLDRLRPAATPKALNNIDQRMRRWRPPQRQGPARTRFMRLPLFGHCHDIAANERDC